MPEVNGQDDRARDEGRERDAQGVGQRELAGLQAAERRHGPDQGERDGQDRGHDAREDRAEHVDAERAPPGAPDQRPGPLQRDGDPGVLEDQGHRGEQQPDVQPDHERHDAQTQHDADEDAEAHARVRDPPADQHGETDADDGDPADHQADQQRQAEQRPEPLLRAVPRLRRGDPSAEHGLPHDDGEQAGRDHAEDPRHGVLHEGRGQRAEAADEVVGSRRGGSSRGEGACGRREGDELEQRDHERDDGRDAEHRLRVAADVADGPVEDLAEPERAQRHHARLGRLGHRPPARDAGQSDARLPAVGRRAEGGCAVLLGEVRSGHPTEGSGPERAPAEAAGHRATACSASSASSRRTPTSPGRPGRR